MFRRPLLPILAVFIGGILGGYGASTSSPSLLLLAAIACTLIIYLLFSSRLSLFCFLITYILVGILLSLNSREDSVLSSLSRGQERVIIEGTVLEPARIQEKVGRLEVNAEYVHFGGRGLQAEERLLVTVYDHPRDFDPGQRIRFPARLRPFRNFQNPGRYNYERAMRLKGLTCAASVSDGRRIVPMGRGDLGLLSSVLERARKPVRVFFQENLSPQKRALFRALILGERQEIPQALRESFNRAGLGHVLAVSGLHVGLVAWLSYSLLKGLLSLSYGLLLRLDVRRVAAALTCLPVFAYACLTGLQVSSQRAMVMALAYLFSIIVGREKEVWSTLALAGLVLLAMDPHSILTVPFQLSFSAVVGILWLVPIIQKAFFAPLLERIPEGSLSRRLSLYFSGLISVTLAATVFLLPIIVYYFHRISLVALPANVMAVPILGLWVIPLGLVSVAFLPVSLSVANLLLAVGQWGMAAMTAIVRFWSDLPWASIWMLTPNALEMALFYGLIFSILFFRRWPWAKLGLLLVVLSMGADVLYWTYRTRFNPLLSVTFLDVGQGSSTFIEFPGKESMLIDGGGFTRGTFDVGRMVVAPFLFHSKRRRVDYLVLTHPQADHLYGLHFIGAQFHPKEFWHNGQGETNPAFRDLVNLLEARGTRILAPDDLREGREISGVKIELLHPFSGGRDGGARRSATALNNLSIVLKLSYGGRSLLIPGDLERAGEEMVLSRAGPRLESDLLLAAHHGSRTSNSKAFLEKVRPRVCVISSGRGNPFGFPHPETLQRLRAVGSRIVRIDQMGSVHVSIGPGRFEVKPSLGSPLQIHGPPLN